MRSRTRQIAIGAVLVLGLGALTVSAAGGSSAQSSGADTQVLTCVKDSGALRVVAATDTCKAGERQVALAPAGRAAGATEQQRPLLLSVPGLVGSSQLSGYEGHLPLTSLQLGAGLAVSAPAGGGPRQSSQPSVSEVTVSRDADGASNGLYRALLEGTVLTPVVLTECADSRCTQVAAQYTLRDVLISGYSASSGGAGTQESLSLNFTGFEITRGDDTLVYGAAGS